MSDITNLQTAILQIIKSLEIDGRTIVPNATLLNAFEQYGGMSINDLQQKVREHVLSAGYKRFHQRRPLRRWRVTPVPIYLVEVEFRHLPVAVQQRIEPGSDESCTSRIEGAIKQLSIQGLVAQHKTTSVGAMSYELFAGGAVHIEHDETKNLEWRVCVEYVAKGEPSNYWEDLRKNVLIKGFVLMTGAWEMVQRPAFTITSDGLKAVEGVPMVLDPATAEPTPTAADAEGKVLGDGRGTADRGGGDTAKQASPTKTERRETWLAKAMLRVKDAPHLPDCEIAKYAGIDPSQLSRDPIYQRAARDARGDKSALPSGHVKKPTPEQSKTEPTDIEAYAPQPGDPIPGSSFYRGQCPECGTAMQVETPELANSIPCERCRG